MNKEEVELKKPSSIIFTQPLDSHRSGYGMVRAVSSTVRHKTSLPFLWSANLEMLLIFRIPFLVPQVS